MIATTAKHSTAQVDAAASDWLIRREAGLTDAEQAEFEQWMAADPRCREAIARAEQAWSLLDRPRQAGREHEMVRALGQRAGRRRRRRAVGAALALAAAVVVSLQWNPMRTPSSDISSALVSAPEKRVLPDGGIIELKPGAELSVDYSGALRRVTLVSGEALFHVAENKQRPFVVTARQVQVRAVGTAFVVAVQTGQVDVVVTQGTVAVERPPVTPAPVGRGEEQPQPALVSAGHRVTVDLGAGAAAFPTIAMSPEEMAARLGWLAPLVRFSDTPLAEAVALINRHSPVQFVIDDPALARMPVSGQFRVDAETLMAFFEKGFGVETQRTGDTVILRRAP